MNYSLIEGLTPPPPGSQGGSAAPSTPTIIPGRGPGGIAPSSKPMPNNALKASMDNAKSLGISSATVPAAAPSAQNGPKVPATASKPTTTSTSTPVTESLKKEGFQQQRPIEYGPVQESKSDDWNLSKWVKDAMRYAKGMGNENRLDSYQYNSGPPIPLPEGELFFFKDTKFSPDCCPGTYSSSLGCACLSKPQFNYLVTRGGNNTVPTGRKTAYYNEY
jgi:hypothetical protein